MTLNEYQTLATRVALIFIGLAVFIAGLLIKF